MKLREKRPKPNASKPSGFSAALERMALETAKRAAIAGTLTLSASGGLSGCEQNQRCRVWQRDPDSLDAGQGVDSSQRPDGTLLTDVAAPASDGDPWLDTGGPPDIGSLSDGAQDAANALDSATPGPDAAPDVAPADAEPIVPDSELILPDIPDIQPPDAALPPQPCRERTPPRLNWAQQQGERNEEMVEFRGDPQFDREERPGGRGHAFVIVTRLKVAVRPVPGAHLDAKRVGVTYQPVGLQGEPFTVEGQFAGLIDDGYEEWHISLGSQNDRGGEYPVLFTAWYLDGLGNLYFDDNHGELHALKEHYSDRTAVSRLAPQWSHNSHATPSNYTIMAEVFSEEGWGGPQGRFEAMVADLSFDKQVFLTWSTNDWHTLHETRMHCFEQLSSSRQRWGIDLELPSTDRIDYKMTYRHGLVDDARRYAFHTEPGRVERARRDECAPLHSHLDWAQMTGQRNVDMVRYSGDAWTEPRACEDESDDACRWPVWVFKLWVRPVPGADLAAKRVGIIHRTFYTSRQETVEGTWFANHDNGLEEWHVRVSPGPEGASRFDGGTVLTFTAWYEDGQGGRFYDDNNGELHSGASRWPASVTTRHVVATDEGLSGHIVATGPVLNRDQEVHLLCSTDDWATTERVDPERCESGDEGRVLGSLGYAPLDGNWAFGLRDWWVFNVSMPGATRLSCRGVYLHGIMGDAIPYALYTHDIRYQTQPGRCAPPPVWTDWAQQQGQRDTERVRYAGTFEVEEALAPPSGVFVDVIVEPAGEGEIGDRQVGIVARTAYTAHQVTIEGTLHGIQEDGREIWRVRFPPSSGERRAFAFTAWYRDRHGDVRYDDNAGDLHIVARMPDMRLVGRPDLQRISVGLAGVQGTIRATVADLVLDPEILLVWTTDGWQTRHESVMACDPAVSFHRREVAVEIDYPVETDRFEFLLVHRHGGVADGHMYSLTHDNDGAPYRVDRGAP